MQFTSSFDYAHFYDFISSIYQTGTFIEIGSFLGESTCYLAQRIKFLGSNVQIFSVDHWKGSDEDLQQQYIQSIGGPDALFNTFLDNLQLHQVQHYVIPLRMDSLQASKLFRDESITFAFIDGDHHYINVLNDIKWWLPKIKLTGTLGGHDYYGLEHKESEGVRRAVQECFGNNFHYSFSTWFTQKT